MGDGRDVFHEPAERALIRTADVYQTNLDEGVAGYSDTLLSIVANFTNSGKEGYNAESMVGKSKRGEVALRLFAVVGEPEDGGEPRFLRAGFKTRGCLAMTACASVICTMIEGKTFTEALAIAPDDVKAALRQGAYHSVRGRGRAWFGWRLVLPQRHNACRTQREVAVRYELGRVPSVRALLAARHAPRHDGR